MIRPLPPLRHPKPVMDWKGTVDHWNEHELMIAFMAENDRMGWAPQAIALLHSIAERDAA